MVYEFAFKGTFCQRWLWIDKIVWTRKVGWLVFIPGDCFSLPLLTNGAYHLPPPGVVIPVYLKQSFFSHVVLLKDPLCSPVLPHVEFRSCAVGSFWTNMRHQ